MKRVKEMLGIIKEGVANTTEHHLSLFIVYHSNFVGVLFSLF